MSRLNHFVHDPNSVLDYVVDWSEWLATGETITAHVVEVMSGDVVLDSSSATTTVTVAWISGGTNATTAKVRHHVTTSDGRQEDRTITLSVRER